MQVKLKVLDGASAGRELPVPGPEFVIGRSEECHLRPKSDMVSRRHCSLVIRDGQVILRDFGSKNGTHVNEQRVEGEKALEPNDVLRIGPLKFGVLFDKGTAKLAKPAAAAPAKEPARSAAAPTATGGKTATADVEDDDISSWLSDIDAAEREQRKFQPETRQFRLTDADRDQLEKAAQGDTAAAKTDDTTVPKEKEKKEPGKLPVRPDAKSKSSQEAAATMLKKFFKSS